MSECNRMCVCERLRSYAECYDGAFPQCRSECMTVERKVNVLTNNFMRT